MKHYIANCTNAFGKDGDCKFRFFNDVSDFATREEEFREAVEEGTNGFLSFEEFGAVAKIPEFFNKFTNLEGDFEFYSLEGSEYREEVLIAYDPAEDIHYFFAE